MPKPAPDSAPTTVVFDQFGVIARTQSATGQAEIPSAAGVAADRAEEFWLRRESAGREPSGSQSGGRKSGPPLTAPSGAAASR
jgi:hypothetical protein